MENSMQNETVKRGPGRPTDRKKDTVLRLRIDSATHKKLGKCAAKQGISMSELVRRAVDEIVKKAEEEEK